MKVSEDLLLAELELVQDIIELGQFLCCMTDSSLDQLGFVDIHRNFAGCGSEVENKYPLDVHKFPP